MINDLDSVHGSTTEGGIHRDRKGWRGEIPKLGHVRIRSRASGLNELARKGSTVRTRHGLGLGAGRCQSDGEGSIVGVTVKVHVHAVAGRSVRRAQPRNSETTPVAGRLVVVGAVECQVSSHQARIAVATGRTVRTGIGHVR